MSRRPTFVPRFAGMFALFALAAMTATAVAAPPVLTCAVSRMSHGSSGTFDVQLPLTAGGTGIECRDTGSGVTVVLSFNQVVTGGTAKVSAGKATLDGNPAFAQNTMTVKLGGVADGQTITLDLSDVTNGGGETLPAAGVTFRTVRGDVNASGSVTAADLDLVKAAVGAGVNGGNFRFDLNSNGSLSAADVNQVKRAVTDGPETAAAAVEPTANTAPTISSIPNQQAVTGVPSTPAGFTVGDAESDPASLFVSAASSNQATVPNANIALAGSGASRTVTITPTAGLTVVVPVTITLTVSDGLASTSTSFTLTVVPPPTTYLATLQPMNSTVRSLGSGYATLQLSGDKTYALLRFNYSNLTSALTDDAVYIPPEELVYDIPVGRALGHQQPDGSFKWVFSAAKAAQIVSAIQANTASMTVQTADYPAGELKGVFKRIIGSQTFVPPADPPSITINPPTKYDASRFLQQAAFGGKPSEVAQLSNASAPRAGTALDDWLVAQFNMPGPIYPTYANAAVAPATQPANPPATSQPTLKPLGPQSTTQPYTASSMYYQIWGRVCLPQPPLVYGDTLDNNRVHEAWWKNAVTAPDQLRQRVATAYSEIFVVSEIEGTINGNIMGLASYYDMLANNAFANFRTILKDVTLHPIMGQYLNMRGNVKATPPQSPNENYAREILQLFSIGLYSLQPDGTLKLDENGQPIPTYDQATITNFAQVFTGWNTDGNRVTIPTLPSTAVPQGSVVNVNSSYQKPMVVTASNHATVQKTLLQYTGAAKYGSATQPSVIPATTSTNSTICNQELDFAIDNIFNHPNVGPFICTRLIQRLVCSNPSPGYVYRVAKVFNNDGTGVRGNMRAVIAAILTDYEARNKVEINEPGYGKMREPMIRIAQMLRSMGAWSKSGKWVMGKTDVALQQTVFRSPTVFNFFDPQYAEPGKISDAGIVSPELGAILATTITSSQNMIYTGIYSHNYSLTAPTGTGFRGDAGGTDIYLNFTSVGTGSGVQTVLETQGQDAMLDQIATLLMGRPLDSSMKIVIANFLNTNISPTDYAAKVRAAVHLISTSPQAAAQK
jgi:uncharacterized protein (DUF1800 family)